MIAIGSDHGGYELRQKVMEHLKERGLEYKDFGCADKSSCDYPIFGEAVAKAVASGECDRVSLSVPRASVSPSRLTR